MTNSPGFELSEGPDYAYEQLAAYLRSRIESGELAPGARLANERELAAEHGVSLSTARRAVRLMQEWGLVVIRPSKGTFIRRLG
jgi:DNA-binding GntR family transcriptional regulator